MQYNGKSFKIIFYFNFCFSSYQQYRNLPIRPETLLCCDIRFPWGINAIYEVMQISIRKQWYFFSLYFKQWNIIKLNFSSNKANRISVLKFRNNYEGRIILIMPNDNQPTNNNKICYTVQLGDFIRLGYFCFPYNCGEVKCIVYIMYHDMTICP